MTELEVQLPRCLATSASRVRCALLATHPGRHVAGLAAASSEYDRWRWKPNEVDQAPSSADEDEGLQANEPEPITVYDLICAFAHMDANTPVVLDYDEFYSANRFREVSGRREWHESDVVILDRLLAKIEDERNA